MSSLIKLDTQRLQDSIGLLLDSTNSEILEAFGVLGDVLKNTGDNNKITQDLLDNCRNFQEAYNEYVECTKGSLKDLEAVVDLSEFHAKRASVGEVEKADLSFKTSGIDVSGALQG
jgi:hypothetical protein